MRCFLVVPLLAGLAAAAIEFTSPASAGDVGDYAQNPTYVLGSVQNILWTSDTDKELSMVLLQSKPNDVFEYVFAGQANLTSFKWNVGTQKSLSTTNIFFFQIFITGATSPSATSHYFNLTRGGTDNSDSSTTSTTSSASSTSSGTGSATSNTAVSQTSSPTNSGTPTPEAKSDGGLSTGAKVGMGVGIPIAIGLGLLAGWFIFGRNRNKNATTTDGNTGGETPGTTYSAPHGEYYAPNAMSEQASGGYKPVNTAATSEAPSTSPPSEIYTPAAAGGGVTEWAGDLAVVLPVFILGEARLIEGFEFG